MNITMAMEENLIIKGRTYAERRGTSLNDILRSYLTSLVSSDSREGAIQDIYKIADTGKWSSQQKWNRDELYD